MDTGGMWAGVMWRNHFKYFDSWANFKYLCEQPQQIKIARTNIN